MALLPEWWRRVAESDFLPEFVAVGGIKTGYEIYSNVLAGGGPEGGGAIVRVQGWLAFGGVSLDELGPEYAGG